MTVCIYHTVCRGIHPPPHLQRLLSVCRIPVSVVRMKREQTPALSGLSPPVCPHCLHFSLVHHALLILLARRQSAVLCLLCTFTSLWLCTAVWPLLGAIFPSVTWHPPAHPSGLFMRSAGHARRQEEILLLCWLEMWAYFFLWHLLDWPHSPKGSLKV